MISAIVYISKEDYSYLETLKSLQNQVFDDKEIIAICDACPLDTLQKIRGVTDKVVAFKTFKGAVVSKNEGAKRARGEILVFVNSGARLSQDVFSNIWNTRDQWVVGTCKVESPDEEAQYREVFEFKNKHLVPRGEHNGVVFCKKLTFEVLDKFNGKVLDENKDLIQRFRKKGRYAILDTPVYGSVEDYVGKSAFKAKIIAFKKFFKSNKSQLVQSEEEL